MYHHESIYHNNAYTDKFDSVCLLTVQCLCAWWCLCGPSGCPAVVCSVAGDLRTCTEITSCGPRSVLCLSVSYPREHWGKPHGLASVQFAHNEIEIGGAWAGSVLPWRRGVHPAHHLSHVCSHSRRPFILLGASELLRTQRVVQ